MNRKLMCLFLGALCVIVGCKNYPEIKRLDAVKFSMKNASSISVRFCGNFNSDFENDRDKIIFDQKQIRRLCNAIVAKNSTWAHREELLTMLTGASILIEFSDSEAQIIIVASDTIVFTENKKIYYYGKTKSGLWKDILVITGLINDKDV